MQRLEQLLKDGAASARSVEEARAAPSVSWRRSRPPVSASGASTNPSARELTVSAPFDGIVQRVRGAGPDGRRIGSSARLAQVDTLWVRVAVYAGDVAAVDETQPAVVRGSEPRKPLFERPASLRRCRATPQRRRSISTTPCLEDRTVSGLESVLAELPLRSTETGLVVPDTAVLYDIHGATWVYEDLGGNAYVRRRVEIARHAGNRAVVRRGLAEGKES